MKPKTQEQLLLELEDLRARLDEAEDTLRAIRSGEVDALVVSGVGGEQVYTLKGADHTYRILIEEMSEGALILTAEGLILYANKRFGEMLNTPIEKVIGSTIDTWVAPDSQQNLQSLLRKGENKKGWQLVLVAGDGTLRTVNVSAAGLQKEDMPGLFCLVLTDLTEQKRTEAVEASEKLARELLAASDQSRLALLSVIEDQKRAEEDFRTLNEELEQRVLERTAQLQATNKQLESEITGRKRAEETLKRRVLELSSLNAMANIVSQSLEVEEILNRAMDESLQQVGVEAAAMLLLNEQAGELVMAAHQGLSDEFVRAFSRMLLGEGLSGRVAQTGEPVIMGDLTEYPGALKAYIEKERIRSAASVPLVGRKGVIGVMNLGASRPHYFDAAGLEMLMNLGRQIAIGVERAQLYAETRQRNRELSVLYTISRATAESLELENTLNNAIAATLEALEIEIGGIYLLEPDGETLTLCVVRGISDETAGNIRQVKFGEDMSGKAVAENKPLVLDVADYPSARLAPHILREGIQSSVSIPLFSAGRAVGAMNLSARRHRAFPPVELELLATIGRQLGNAVQNARLYETLQQRTTQLEAANKELEAFAYSVSHDLRSPLRAVDGFSRILMEEYQPQLSPDAQHYLNLVRTNALQMGQLIDDLLTFSRTSRQALAKRSVNPAEIVRQVLEELQSELVGRKAEVIIGDLPECAADPAMLKSVIFNLISNAVKFTQKKEVTQLEIGSINNEGMTTYFVKDNGVGFDMRYSNKLFGVFQRLHSGSDYEGTGVGLAMVQRIIQKHGGRVWAEAEVDKGATFYFTLEGGESR